MELDLGHLVPLNDRTLAFGDHVTDGGVDFLHGVILTDEDIFEYCHAIFIGVGVNADLLAGERGSVEMESHAFHEVILGGLDDLEVATLQLVVYLGGGYLCPFYLHILTVGYDIFEGSIHFLQHVTAADEDVLEIRLAGAVHGGSHIDLGTAVGGAGETKLDSFGQTVLGSLGDGKITALEDVAERYGRSLSRYDGYGFCRLRFVAIFHHLSHGVSAGAKVIHLNYTAVFRGYGLIDTVTCNGELDAVHNTVLTVLDDLYRSGGSCHLEVGRHRIVVGRNTGYHVLVAVFVSDHRPNEETGSAGRCRHSAVELDGDGISQRLSGADGHCIAVDRYRGTAVYGYSVLGEYIVGVSQRDGILAVCILHFIGLCRSCNTRRKAWADIMGCHIRKDQIVVFLQILVARILLGHRAGVSVHRIGLIVQLRGRRTEAHSDLPDNKLCCAVAGVGILTCFQIGSVGIAVCQCQGEQVLLLGREHLILVAVCGIGRCTVVIAVGQWNAMLNAEATYIILAVLPIGFVSCKSGNFSGIVMHFSCVSTDCISERIVCCR